MNTYAAKIRAKAAKRRAEMLSLRAQRWKLREIGARYGVSAERVRQILAVKVALDKLKGELA
jgi:DNA-directed RNA polymerase sigma subunit (sigma70/sigma32)